MNTSVYSQCTNLWCIATPDRTFPGDHGSSNSRLRMPNPLPYSVYRYDRVSSWCHPDPTDHKLSSPIFLLSIMSDFHTLSTSQSPMLDVHDQIPYISLTGQNRVQMRASPLQKRRKMLIDLAAATHLCMSRDLNLDHSIALAMLSLTPLSSSTGHACQERTDRSLWPCRRCSLIYPLLLTWACPVTRLFTIR